MIQSSNANATATTSHTPRNRKHHRYRSMHAHPKRNCTRRRNRNADAIATSTAPHHQSSHYDTSQPTTTYTANTQLVTLPRYSDATAIATESPMQPNADATTIATAICIETAHYILVFPHRSHRRYRQQTNADATTTANATAYDTQPIPLPHRQGYCYSKHDRIVHADATASIYQ